MESDKPLANLLPITVAAHWNQQYYVQSNTLLIWARFVNIIRLCQPWDWHFCLVRDWLVETAPTPSCNLKAGTCLSGLHPFTVVVSFVLVQILSSTFKVFLWEVLERQLLCEPLWPTITHYTQSCSDRHLLKNLTISLKADGSLWS